MDENAFERYFRSGKTAINIAEAAQYSLEIRTELIKAHSPWSNSDIKAAFEKKYGADNFSLQGMPRVVKGQEPTIAITHEQFSAIEGIFGIDAAQVIGKNVYAVVSAASSGQTEKAKLVWLHARSPLNQIIISQGLANMLRLEADEEIQVLDIGEDIYDLDLDQFR